MHFKNQVCQLIVVLLIISSCSSRVQIIKNEQPYYKEAIKLKVLDQAKIKLPFNPASVKLYPADCIKASWKDSLLEIKALEAGSGKIILLDNDNIKLGTIDIVIIER